MQIQSLKKVFFGSLSALFFLTLVLSSCKDKETKSDVQVTGITLASSTTITRVSNQNRDTLTVGTNSTVTVTVAPSTATNKAVRAISSSTAAATVAAVSGRTDRFTITPVAAGNTTITFTSAANSRVTATIAVVVQTTTDTGGGSSDNALLTGFKIANENVTIVAPDANGRDGSNATDKAIQLAATELPFGADVEVPTALVATGFNTATEGFQADAGTTVKNNAVTTGIQANITFSTTAATVLKVEKANARTTYYTITVTYAARPLLSGTLTAESTAGTAATGVTLGNPTGTGNSATDGRDAANAIPITINVASGVSSITAGTISIPVASIPTGAEIKMATQAAPTNIADVPNASNDVHKITGLNFGNLTAGDAADVADGNNPKYIIVQSTANQGASNRRWYVLKALRAS